MTLTACLADLYRFFHYTTSPPTAITTRLTAFLNDVQREILTKPGLVRLRDSTIPVTALADTARTGLPPIVSRINGPMIDRTNGRRVWPVTLAEIRAIDPAQANTSSAPEVYADVGYQEVQYQPAAATGLWAVSSSASDTVPAVYVQTITTGGYQYADTEVLTGITRVAVGTGTPRTDHIEVTKFYLSAACVGYISLYDAAAAGTELARIEPGKTFARYVAVEWHPIQTDDVTLYVDFTRTIPDLVNGTDEPLLPDDFHQVVVDGARKSECLFINDARYAACAVEYQTGMNALTDWAMNTGDQIASLRPLSHRRSSLTGMSSQYPADGPFYG